MKEIFKKAIIILISMMILLNSSLLLVVSKAVDIVAQAIDESKTKVVHEINLEKYVNYTVGEDKGTLLQVDLKTGVQFEEGQEYCPIRKTDIVLNFPQIEGKYPERVELIGLSTKATNGDEYGKDIQNNYNKSNGELKIETFNKGDKKGNIYSEKVDGARDEYKLILYYGSEVFNVGNIARNLEIKGAVQINFANEAGTSKKEEFSQAYDVTENISGLIGTNIQTNDIYNGAIKANQENGASQRTEYIENVTINPSYKNLSDEVQISLNNSFIDNKDIEIPTDEIVYKNTKINKNEVLEQLGEDGYLQILNENGEVLGEVNKDTEVQENGIYEINYENEISKIFIKTSKIKELRGITIQNVRQIKESMKDIDIHKIQVKSEISCINNEDTKQVYNFTDKKEVEIKDAETRIDLSIDKNELINSTQNDVILTADLITDKLQFNLFKNPVLEIKLPSEVEKVILGDVSLLYDDNLRITSAEVVDREGSKVIILQMQGTQNSYILDNMVSGPHIVIPATLIVKKDIESVETKIKWNYTNETTGNNDYIINGIENKELDVTIYSVINNYIQSNNAMYNVGAENNTNISAQIKAVLGNNDLTDGQSVHEKEYIRYIVSLKNNTRNKIDGVKVNGNVPQGTVYVETILGDYSFTEKDRFVLKEDTNKTQYEETVSLEAGEEKYIEYWVRANSLQNGENSKEISNSIKVSKDGNTIQEYNIKNNIIKAEMELKLRQRETERGPNIWIYDIYAKNIEDHVLNNVSLNINLPKNIKFSHIELQEDYKVEETINGIKVTIPKIEVNQERHIELFMQLNGFDDGELQYMTDTVVYGKINNGNDTYYSNPNKENVYGAGVKVVQSSEKEGKELQYDEEVEYDFNIENITPEQSKNSRLSLEIYNYADKNLIPSRVEYEYYEYDTEKQDYVLKKETKDISKAFVEDGELNLYLALGSIKGKNISVKLFFKAGEVYELTETSNNMTIKYEYAGETYTVVSNIIKNKILPREFDVGKDDPDDPNDPNDPEVPDAPDNPDDPYDPKPNPKPDDPSKPDNPDDPNVRYTLKGFAWEDKNKDGKYNENENKLKDITVKLFDADSNSIVKDGNGKNYEVKTDNNGTYNFENISKGKYLILFEYDNGKYGLTTYKKSGVDENNNSDVVQKIVAIDGVEKTVAVTDIIDIENNSNYNFNVGLVQNEDLKITLDKSITNVILREGNANKEYSYNESKLAKVEVHAKKVSNSSIGVQYQLKITNEGNVDAYIDEIVDYLPEGFDFDSELNDGWSKSSNGTLKNTSLSGVIIKAGTSKTVNLYLTKRLSSESVGTVTNKASILKGTSVNGNLLSEQSNKDGNNSEAKLIISIKTGALLYTSIILITIIGLIVIKILIDKKIINIKILGCLIIGILAIYTVFSNSNISNAGDKSAAVIKNKYTNDEGKAYAEAHHSPKQGPTGCYYTTVKDTNPTGGQWTTGPFDEGLRDPNTGAVIYTYHHHTAVNYIHHGFAHGDHVLFCEEGGAMAEAPAVWTYSYSRVAISSLTITEEDRKDVATVTNNGSNPEFIKLAPTSGNNSEYFLVGPYNIKYSGTITKFEVNSRNVANGKQTPLSRSEYKIVDINGNEFSVSGQRYKVPNGQDFYIRVKKDISWLGDINIRVDKEGSIKYRLRYSYQEHWTGGGSGAQILGYTGDDGLTITDWIPRDTYNTLRLKGVRVPVGNLLLQKCDKDTGEAIKGFKIKLENADYYYYKEIEDGGPGDDDGQINGKILVKNLPVKYGKAGEGIAKIEYTITEIVAPSGYDLELQAESDVIQVKTLLSAESNSSGGYTVRDKVVTKNNKQYGDLSVIKADQTTFDKMNGVGFIIYKEVSGVRNYISSYQYKQNEPANVSWTTDVTQAMCFYTGIQGQEVNGYIVGNCTAEDGRILLKNLPVKDGTSANVIYNAVEYRFDYDKNPDLIYYKLDKTKTETVTLITNAYNNTSSDSHQVTLTRYAITEFYTSDYIKKMLKEANAENVVSGIYQAIMGQTPNANFVNANVSLLNASKTQEGYDQATIKRVIDSIYSDTNNASTILARAKAILNDENSIVSFRDYLFSVVGIQNDDIKDSMKDFAYYALKSQTMAIMKNKQYTIDIKGIVWEDIAAGGDKTIWTGNSLLHGDDTDTEDNIVTGITVELYAEPNQQGTRPTLIAETTKEGYKFKGAEFVLDANGNRVLDENGDPKIQYNIIIDHLRDYWIEFEYNGLKYQNVLTEKELRDPNNSNYKYSIDKTTSKAKEKPQDRSAFNESFAEISGNTPSTVSQQSEDLASYRDAGETTGYSKDGNGNNTNGLKYESVAEKTQEGEHIQKSTLLSELLTEKEYSVSSMQNKVFNSSFTPNTPQGVAMRADTGTAGCDFMDMYEQIPEGAREITDVNLGIFKREQPDLAVATDLDNIKLSINGYNHTYNYKQRLNNKVVPDNLINSAYDFLMDGFSVAVKRNGTYRDLEYEREIYDSYIAYTKYLEDHKGEPNIEYDNRLKMYVNYTILVKNESSSLISQVNLRNYADSRLNLVSATFEDGTQAGDWELIATEGNMKKWQTKNLINKNIPAGESIKLNLTYEVPANVIISMADSDNYVDLYANLTEIASYSTWNQNGERYAGIDRDSAPNNINYGITSTYEDDTDAAPSLRIKRKDYDSRNKQITGTVFEDNPVDENGNTIDNHRNALRTEKERRGNGQYDNNENSVENVKVELLNYETDEPVQLYTLNGVDVSKEPAQAITKADGKYNFVGLVPGEYYLKYTYGKFKYNNEIKQTEISDGTEVTTENYKSTIVEGARFRTLLEDINNINGNKKNKNSIINQGLCYWYDHITPHTPDNTGNDNRSSAVDDVGKRNTITEELEKLTFNVKKNYENIQQNESTDEKLTTHYMDAYTGLMDVAIEDQKDQVSEDGTKGYSNGKRDYQIKFGIIERPRQSLQVIKDINKMSLTLANGQVLAQGNPIEDKINYVTYPEGNRLKIEVDSELLEGANLELNYRIIVKNNSELDYTDTEYYRYGTIDPNNIVKLYYSIADYGDEKLSFTYDIEDPNGSIQYYSTEADDRWQLIKDASEENKLAGIDISPTVYNNVKNRSNILVRNRKSTNSIKPGEEDIIELLAKKLLTNLIGNDQTFNNYAEIIKVVTPAGRFYGSTIGDNKWKTEDPGNYDPTIDTSEDKRGEDDNNDYIRAQTVIVPPTGDARNIAIYITIGLGTLLILAGGIILIKKVVLK